MERFVFQPLFSRGHVKLPGSKQTTKPFINALEGFTEFQLQKFWRNVGHPALVVVSPTRFELGHPSESESSFIFGKKNTTESATDLTPNHQALSLTAIKETNANCRDIPVDSTIVR